MNYFQLTPFLLFFLLVIPYAAYVENNQFLPVYGGMGRSQDAALVAGDQAFIAQTMR